jgi:hypothetical protein
MYTRTTSLLALYIRNTRRYEHPLFGVPDLSGRRWLLLLKVLQ